MIASLLHDIASVSDYTLYAEHQLHGARIPCGQLSRFDYKGSKITLVQAWIQNHRGSLCRGKNTMEEICPANALSHFDPVPILLYLSWNKHSLEMLTSEPKLLLA